jgi:hypothetical protein
VRDPVLGWTNRPGFVDEELRLDSRGLRSPEPPAERPVQEALRMLVVGASQVFGLGVADGETWRDVLEGELTRDHGPGRARLLNGAVQGYSTTQICRRAMLLIPELEPDLVVCFVYPGRQSLLDPSSATRWEERNGELVPAGLARGWPAALAWIPRGLHRLLRGSNLYARHQARRWRQGAYERDGHFVLSRAAPRPETRRLLDATREVVGELARQCREREIELRLALLPALHGCTEEGWERYLALYQDDGAPPVGTPRREPLEALADWLAPTGAETWDLYDTASYIGQNPERHVLQSSQHWSPAGHRVMALSLHHQLQADGALVRLLVEPR